MTAPKPAVAARPVVDHQTQCRTRDVLNRVGDKWSLAVIHALAWGHMRFMELMREITGISQRMLTVTVRGLERDGLVSRTVFATVPPRVDYQLTDLGRTLLDTVCQLMAWTVEHLDEIDQARDQYDLRTAAGSEHPLPSPGDRDPGGATTNRSTEPTHP